MQLTGKQIVNKGIIYNVDEKGIQQQGVDVRVKKISRVSTGLKNGVNVFSDIFLGKSELDIVKDMFEGTGLIPASGKTSIPTPHEVTPIQDPERGVDTWFLHEGYYEVEFMEGCEIPADCAMYFKTRSSLVRCGADVRSGQFDGGFKTENMGAFLKVELPIRIDVGARIAQAIVTETYPVDEDKLYDGQWQGDKQRG